ncbi:Rv3654c family TadE-like protein [Arthrobacter sp.]|uniref:Rv3654c family TadE-like protein n=1 Tax=Arthrobacter sp. TaxID=1667 RepID=UPI003A8E105B
MDDEALASRRPGFAPWAAQAGSGTVLVVALVAAAVFGLMAVLAVTAAASAAGRAASAADLAALAAADAARGLTGGEPCTVAAEVAARNEARLIDCGRSGPGGAIVDVWTSVDTGPGTIWLSRLGLDASGRARAGPPQGTWQPGG